MKKSVITKSMLLSMIGCWLLCILPLSNNSHTFGVFSWLIALSSLVARNIDHTQHICRYPNFCYHASLKSLWPPFFSLSDRPCFLQRKDSIRKRKIIGGKTDCKIFLFDYFKRKEKGKLISKLYLKRKTTFNLFEIRFKLYCTWTWVIRSNWTEAT